MEGINQVTEAKSPEQIEKQTWGARREHLMQAQQETYQMFVDKGILNKNGEVTGIIKSVERPRN